jgi:hypothetical protein
MSRSPDPTLADVQAALSAWLADHPTATLGEIEQAADHALRDLRAALISTAGQTREPDVRPTCPECQTPMHRSARRTIRRRTAHEGDLALEGQTWVCPACGAGLFPPR